MPKHLTGNEKDMLIADHKTGNYSQRKLSSKYEVSLGYVNKTLKEIGKIDEDIVNAGIAYKTELAKRDEHSVNAIEHVVNERTKHLEFINNITLKNLSVMARKINKDTTISEHKMIGETADKSAITLGVAERHSNSNVTVNTQNNLNQHTEVKTIDDIYE